MARVPPPGLINAGDTLEVSVQTIGPDGGTCISNPLSQFCHYYAVYSLTDTTSGASYSSMENNLYIASTCTDPQVACFPWQTAEGVVERPTIPGLPSGDFWPMPDFRKVHFTSGTFLDTTAASLGSMPSPITQDYLQGSTTLFQAWKATLENDLCDNATTKVAGTGAFDVAYHYVGTQSPLNCFVADPRRLSRAAGRGGARPARR